MPKVSIIIASYNTAKYIKQSIQSVLDQTFQDFEILIADDASSDNSIEEIKQIKDKRIKLYEFKENQGQFVVTNYCLQRAYGKYICILNADDAFEKQKLEKQTKFLDKNPNIGATFSFASLIDEDGKDFKSESHFYSKIFGQENRSRFDWLNFFFYNGGCFCHPSVMIRKSCHDQIGLYDQRYAQLGDLDFWVRLCLNYEVHVISEKLTKFRIRKNEQNTSADSPKSHIRTSYEFSHVFKNYLKIQNSEEFIKIFPESLTRFRQVKSKFIPFYLGIISLDLNTPEHKKFGLDVLFDTFSNTETAEEIEQHYGFSYKDIIKLTSKTDIFNVESKIKNKKLISLLIPFTDFEKYYKSTQAGEVIRKFFKTNSEKTICLYGAGSFAGKIINLFSEYNNIAGIIDKNIQKYNKKLGSFKIYSLQELENINPDIVIPLVLDTRYIKYDLEKIKNAKGLKFRIEENLLGLK